MAPEEAMCHGFIPSEADVTYGLVESHNIDLYNMSVSWRAHTYRIESTGKPIKAGFFREVFMELGEE